MEGADPLTLRMLEFIEHKGMSKSEFADAIGLNRSILSHVLSGRNKPSLAMVEKMAAAFEELDLYWLLLGKERALSSPPVLQTEEVEVVAPRTEELPPVKNSEAEPQTPVEPVETEILLVLNTDGTYHRYIPRKK
ncbi:helix-turn-helix domain-containing protein [bacterium]|nr:helix-turn-helix domain-containing protein [bacterium]